VGPGGFDIFSNYQTGSNFEIEKECLTVVLDRGIVNNSQILHAIRLGHCEQFSQLCQRPILNRIRFKNPGIDPPFESLMNF
jgi:hypothetical protein